MDQACIECSAPVTEPALTGVLCRSCFDNEQNADTGSILRSPLSVAFLGVGSPIAFQVTIDGLNYVKLIGGAAAVVAALATIPMAVKAPDSTRAKIFFAMLISFIGGGFHLYTSGLF